MTLSESRESAAFVRFQRELALRSLQDTGSRLLEARRQVKIAESINRESQESVQRRAAVAAIEGTELPEAQAAVDAADQALADVRAAYDTEAAAEPALWSDDGSLPVLMLPVRVEAVYREGGTQLWVRIYPDDVHVDSHEPGLTASERAAGLAYWEAIASDDAQPRRDQAWSLLLAAVGRSRAPWVARQLSPAEPDPPVREAAWTRAAHTTLLPDRFVVSGYRHGALTWRVEGSPVPDVLPVSFAPPGADAATGSDLPWDDASRWLVDFDAAVAAGMGVRVTLPDDDPQYDLLTVVGVLHDIDAATGAQRVSEALAAHRFTDGLDLLPAGTPTNNTPATRSAWRSTASPPPPEVAQARRTAFDPAGVAPGARLARALGVDGREVLATLDGAGADDEPTVDALQGLVGQMLAWSSDWRPPDSTELLVAGMQPLADHFRAHVRSRGPLPTLRIGRQPYGVLPATSFDLWRGTDVPDGIVDVLASFLTYYEEKSIGAVQVGSGPDQDATLLDLLSRRASSASVTLARGGGPPAPPSVIGAVPWGSTFSVRGFGRYPTPALDVLDPAPPELQAVAAQRPIQQCADLLKEITAFFDTWDWSAGPPPEAAMAPLTARFGELDAAMKPLVGADAAGVLYPMLLPVAETALFCTFVIGQGVHNPAGEPTEVRTLRLALAHVVDAVVQAAAIEARAVDDFGHVERLLCETVDTTTHRLDAWITSMATARLARLRSATPAGLRVGAYGWLTDLAPVDPADRRALDGYVVTPSLHHATTAAVLRSGYLAHADKEAFAVNLTSRRVRRALALLDGVRAGQRLPALLGYQLERALHDAHLDQHIAGFRARYPLAPLVDAAADDEARIALGARSVVDGEAVRRDRAAFAGPPPRVDLGGDLAAVLPLLADLDESVDALGDLLLAESVHHLVGGNPLRAGSTVDALGGGDQLPSELEVVATPRSVTLVSYALGALVPAAAPAGWAEGRAMSLLEPGLETLARSWLGPPSAWVLGVADGEISLADAGISAVEGLLGAVAAADASGSPLLRRLLRGRGGLTPDGVARYGELTELCARWRGVLAGAVPLLPSHVVPGGGAWAAVDVDDLAARVSPWAQAVESGRAALRTARNGLAGEPLGAVAALVAALDDLAACGVRGSVCAGEPDGDAARQLLIAQADTVLDLLAAAPSDPVPAPPAEPTAAAAQAWVGALTERVRAVCGDAFRLLPRVDLGEAAAAFSVENRPVGADDGAVADWLRDVGRVRPAAAAYAEALLGGEVLAGSAVPTYQVGQSPAAPGRPWVATGRAADDGPRTAGSGCCVLTGDSPVGAVVVGLVIDAWSEALPRAPRPGRPPEEVAGIAFHIDRPDARAPQAALIAVPPDPVRGWRLEDLHAVVVETALLARLRTLDLRDLPDLRAVVPPTWFGD